MPLNLNFSASAKLPHREIRPLVSASASASVKYSSPNAKNYVSNGYNMTNMGYLANPTHAAQVAANNAGALTGAEASRMGLPLGGRK
jgi:hypothetical protein